jgi:AraC-like DNA-binding protein
LNGSDIYREWAAPLSWRGVVACLWEQRVITDFDHRVVPDGCADVIVGFGGAFAVGLADGPVMHRLAAGSGCRGLRLRPEAVTTFFGVPGAELRNLNVPLDEVVGARRARGLVDVVLHGRPDDTMTTQPPEHVRRAFQLLRRMSVDEAAVALGFSSRQFRRIVVEHSGLGPKTYQRVVRLRQFLANDGPLAQAATDAGYADQAHLTREVTCLCGLPPAALRAERGRLVGSSLSWPITLEPMINADDLPHTEHSHELVRADYDVPI